jgi:hypothetical protein
MCNIHKKALIWHSIVVPLPSLLLKIILHSRFSFVGNSAEKEIMKFRLEEVVYGQPGFVLDT